MTAFNLVHLAIRIGGGVDHALVYGQRLHLQFLRLEDGSGLAVGRDARFKVLQLAQEYIGYR